MSTLVTVVAFAHGVAEGAREAFLPDDISPFCGRGDSLVLRLLGSGGRVQVGRSNAREQREPIKEMWIANVPEGLA